MLNYLKTLYYNFHFFGIQGLLHLPLIVYKGVLFKDTSGKITVNGKLKTGIIRIGSHEPLATKDLAYERTIMDISGELLVDGNVHIAPGSRISIDKGARLKFGNNFNSTGNCTIICNSEINIGNDCLFSWDIQLMDSDFHKIYDNKGVCINPPKRIDIGNNVWICSKATILKGVRIPDGCVVGAGSVLSGQFRTENSIIAGIGKNCQIVRSEIKWVP